MKGNSTFTLVQCTTVLFTIKVYRVSYLLSSPVEFSSNDQAGSPEKVQRQKQKVRRQMQQSERCIMHCTCSLYSLIQTHRSIATFLCTKFDLITDVFIPKSALSAVKAMISSSLVSDVLSFPV